MYTEKSAENTREQQTKRPMTPSELSLSLTKKCLQYLVSVGDTFDSNTHILNVLSPHNAVLSSPIEHLVPKTLNQLKQSVSFIVDTYKGRRRNTPYEEEIGGVLVAVQLEWHWRMMRVFMDTKCLNNGDVFPKNPPYASAFQDLCQEVSSLKEPIPTNMPEKKA